MKDEIVSKETRLTARFFVLVCADFTSAAGTSFHSCVKISLGSQRKLHKCIWHKSCQVTFVGFETFELERTKAMISILQRDNSKNSRPEARSAKLFTQEPRRTRPVCELNE